MVDGEGVRRVGQVCVDRGQGRGRQRQKRDEQIKRRANSRQASSDSSGENMRITAIRRMLRPSILTANAAALNLGCT